MISVEYVRNCNCNYERIALEEKPEEKRYQYCILGRGGIRYLLPCSLRYIDNNAFLYYDISSTQNIGQVFAERKVSREWFKDFLWGKKQMRYELDRFLLEEENIVWSPEHVYQDLEKNNFFFLYVPYYKGENGLEEFCDFLVEHIDYEDEVFVEFVYAMYDKIRQNGLSYLEKQIYEDFQKLEDNMRKEIEIREVEENQEIKQVTYKEEKEKIQIKEPERKSILHFWEGKKRKTVKKEAYRESLRSSLKETPVYAVCEESKYFETKAEEGFEEEFGKTIYIEETTESEKAALYKTNGEKVTELIKFPFVIGKKKENSDLVLNDYSASRVHARITMEEGVCYLEDLNSTNGTYKNGLRLQPYEKRRLESGDELKFGKTEYIYR